MISGFGGFFVESSRPPSIVDLECEWIKQRAGIRIIMDEAGRLGVELKGLEKPKYLQKGPSPIMFPLGPWVEVKAHVLLWHQEDGVIRLHPFAQ